MHLSAANKNYLLGTQLSFLIISFVLIIIGMTVQYDIWPFLQMSLPINPLENRKILFAIFFALILLVSWLCVDWSYKTVRYSLMTIILMLAAEGLTGFVVTRYFFVSMLVPTSILYFGYRIIQFIYLQRALIKTHYRFKVAKAIRSILVGTNLLFWALLWIKLTFFIFPQIIYQIS